MARQYSGVRAPQEVRRAQHVAITYARALRYAAFVRHAAAWRTDDIYCACADAARSLHAHFATLDDSEYHGARMLELMAHGQVVLCCRRRGL